MISRMHPIALAAAILTVIPVAVSAGPMYSGTITGVFTNPVLTGDIINVGGGTTAFNNTATAVTSGVGTNTFRWGSFPSGAFPFSEFVFEGATFVDQPIDEPFVLGTFRYLNGTSDLTTMAFGVTLTLSITGTGIFTPDSTDIMILTTANGGADQAADADFVSFDKFPNTFNVFEGSQAQALLIGSIIGDPELHIQAIMLAPGEVNGFIGPIPEPGSVILAGLGLVGLALLGRRIRKP